MSPIRTRAQIRNKSEVPPPAPRFSYTPQITAAGNSTQPSIVTAPATRFSNVKKIPCGHRRKSFKIEVLADRTSSLNVVVERKLRRKTSFHPESISLTKVTPPNEVKEASLVETTVRRRRRMARRDRLPSLHVHWADNLCRVAPSSPPSSLSVQETGEQPRSILRVFCDDWSDVTSAGTLESRSNAVHGTPLYALPEVPRSITLRRPRRDFGPSPHPRASVSQTLPVEDLSPDAGNTDPDESFTGDAEQAPSAPLRIPAKSMPAERNNSTLIRLSRLKVTRTASAASSTTHGHGAISGPPAASSSSVSVRPTQGRVRRPAAPADNRAFAPPPLPAEIPVVLEHRWLNLPENRIDRWIIVFYMIYAPIILPLLLRVLGMI